MVHFAWIDACVPSRARCGGSTRQTPSAQDSWCRHHAGFSFLPECVRSSERCLLQGNRSTESGHQWRVHIDGRMTPDVETKSTGVGDVPHALQALRDVVLLNDCDRFAAVAVTAAQRPIESLCGCCTRRLRAIGAGRWRLASRWAMEKAPLRVDQAGAWRYACVAGWSMSWPISFLSTLLLFLSGAAGTSPPERGPASKASYAFNAIRLALWPSLA